MTAALDFATLPPEINSARMYSGAGSAPMLAAASAWHGLSAELRASALSYSSVLSTLTGEEWHGPASASMTAAAAPCPRAHELDELLMECDRVGTELLVCLPVRCEQRRNRSRHVVSARRQ